MNKRDIQKAATKEKIVTSALELFSEKGIINTTTLEISQKAEIAHGTMFIHFPTKELLISELLDRINDDFTAIILNDIKNSESFEGILDIYLNNMITYENFFASLYRELSFYSPELQRKIIYKQSILADIIIRFLKEKCIAENSELNVVLATNQFIGTIFYYLSLKSFFTKEGSVLESIRDDLICHLKCLINCQSYKKKAEGK